MINELKLSWNKLLLYAIIYWYSQDWESSYTGSLSYIQKALWLSRPTVISLLNSLVKDWLIIKIEASKKTLPTKRQASKESLPTNGKENLPAGSKETLPNIYNNTNNNNTNNNKREKIKKEKEEIYFYYIDKMKVLGGYNMKFNKKALALERIWKALKKLTKQQIINIIDTYSREQSETIAKWYVKMCQYFFWPIERWSSVMYYEEWNREGAEEEIKKAPNELIW